MPSVRRALGLKHQTVLLLVFAVIASLVITALAYEARRRGDYADFRDARARGLAAQVHTARTMLLAVPSTSRLQLSKALAASGTLQVFPAERAGPPGDVPAPVPHSHHWPFAGHEDEPAQLAEALVRYTQPSLQVEYRPTPSPRYWVRVEVADEAWWIVVLDGRPPGGAPTPPWGAWALITGLLLLAAAAYAATITRPLADLAEATRRVGDAWPPPVVPRGPREVRSLAASFNAMLGRLREVESERRVLLGGLPHDLRAPLARLRLRLAMLPESRELEGVHADLASIERIVRQFTDYLRGEGDAPPSGQPLAPLVLEAVEAYRSVGRDVRPADLDAGGVSAPPGTVRRLLDNLIDNALQHGRPPVAVAARRLDAAHVALEVTDAGQGIAVDQQARALAPFTKLDDARGLGGCGLGLAIVAQLARRQGGRVSFAGGAGAFTVRVELPVTGGAPRSTPAPDDGAVAEEGACAGSA
jgi:signal transduction histidine kinase